MKEELSKIGRPKVSTKNKKSAKIFINLKEDEKLKLQNIANNENLSLSQLCYKALKEKKYI